MFLLYVDRGVNGVGKIIIFLILSGDIKLISGDVFIIGNFVLSKLFVF